MKNKIKNIKIKRFTGFLLIAAAVFSSTEMHADGSRDLYPSGKQGRRAYLRAYASPNTSWPFANDGVHYVYAKAGEVISMASSTQGKGGNSRIRLFAPDGSQVVNNTTNGAIANRTAELAGPQLVNQTGGNRYLPIYHTATTEGIYRVEFVARGTTDPSSSVNANDNWSQTNNDAGILAWDVSVINSSNTGFVSGRVYTNVLNLTNGTTQPNTTGFEGLLYVLTKDGYTYRVNNNGNNGMWFTFFVNNNGFLNPATGEPVYKSQSSSDPAYLADRIHNPNNADTGRQITHKMFYTLPASDLPVTATGAVPGSTTWLKNPVVTPEVTGVKLVGVEGTSGQVSNKGGFIEFNAATQGNYTVVIEGTGTPPAFVTRVLTGTAIQGLNKISWDGKDGAGNALPVGTAPAKITVQLQGAEVHFPFFDMEYNRFGTLVELLNHTNLNNVVSDIVYWDDTDVPSTNNGSNPNPKNNTHLPPVNSSGISSSTNGHIWGINGSGTGNLFGDNRSIDTWTFIKGEAVTIATDVAVKVADLQVTEVSANQTNIVEGDALSFTVKVKNNGPSDAAAAVFNFILPPGFDPENAQFTSAGCGAEAVAITYDAATRTYSSKLDLPDQCEITYVITVKATNGVVQGNQYFEATILRPNDVSDPDATNPDTSIPPTDAHYECANNGLGGNCNNITASNVVLFSVNYCITGDCNPNTYVNAADPNTIEYDNMVGVFHSTLVKEANGVVKVWGQGIDYNGSGSTGNVLLPKELNSTNYAGLTGDILKFTGGSNGNTQQFAVLTTTGLFIWGNDGILVPSSIKSAGSFGTVSIATYGMNGGALKADGLPFGISPSDVKMMFGSNQTLGIVTCTGAAWILSQNGNKYGDGTVDNAVNDVVWHRIKTNAAGNPELTNVVAMRGNVNAMMALTATGEIYTWGSNIRTADNSGPFNSSFAVLMNKPAGITPKMIGMTRSSGGNTYYLLASNGDLYSLGENESAQLGNFSTTDSDSWIRVRKSSAANDFLQNVAWISPQEHEGGNYAAINVLTSDGKLWAWGSSNNGMIGAGSGNVNPTYMPGKTTGAYDAQKLNDTDTMIAVETGGHTTIAIKQCSTKFGYVGHRINGSMANGSTTPGTESLYNFADTSDLMICGAIAGPVVKDLKICKNTTADLNDAAPLSFPQGASGVQWWTTIDRQPGTQVSSPSSVGAGTYYAFYSPLIVSCASIMTVSYLEPGDAGYQNCTSVLITNPMIRQMVK